MAIRIEQFAQFGISPAGLPRAGGPGGGQEIAHDPRRQRAPHPAAKEAREALARLAEELRSVSAPEKTDEAQPVRRPEDPEKVVRPEAARRNAPPPIVDPTK